MTSAAIQPSPRPISPRTVLVDLSAVRAARGVDAYQISKWVDEGKFIWCWDISAEAKQKTNKGPARALRFWAAEVWPTEDVSRLALETVIARILPGSRQAFTGSEISLMLMASRQQVKRLRSNFGGKVERRILRVPRESLAAFLHRCWIGGGNT